MSDEQNTIAQSSNRSRIQLKLNRPTKAETGAAPAPAAKAPSLADLIGEEVSAATPQQTAEPETFLKEMVCVKCGLLADVDMDVPSCECPDCNGTMFPSDAEHDRTVSYLEDEEENDNLVAGEADDGVEYGTTGPGGIKVAQPVNVGMFTGASPSSSQKGIDFLSTSSSSSNSSLRVTESQKNLHARITELEMVVKNLEEEKAEMARQQEQLNVAITEFNEKRKAFEQYRLEFELRTQAAEGPTPLNMQDGDNLQMAKTQTGFSPIAMAKSKQSKVMTITIAVMGAVIFLQFIIMLIIALKK